MEIKGKINILCTFLLSYLPKTNHKDTLITPTPTFFVCFLLRCGKLRDVNHFLLLPTWPVMSLIPERIIPVFEQHGLPYESTIKSEKGGMWLSETKKMRITL